MGGWMLISAQIENDFVSAIAKKVTESRKKVLDGVAQGVLKVVNNHSS
jgi:N-terminal acetyltransferase B complex non-catalytic subunit